MQRLARYGHIWKHKKTGKFHGASIDVKNHEELSEYEQIPRPKVVEQKAEEAPKENKETEFSPKTRRAE